jgi:MFS family permease
MTNGRNTVGRFPLRNDDAGPPRSSRLRSLGRALKHRNYRLFFFGQSISLIGTWMTRVATSWLIYRLTGSAMLLGVVGFAGQVPTFLLAPVAGVLVDRWDRQRVLIVTQVLAMMQSALLAALALSGVITVTHVVILSVFQGLINAFDMPTRQALVVHMVEDRADLANAIALNSSTFNAARLVGPAIAGLLIVEMGEGLVFLVNGVSYVAVIAALLAIRVAPRPPASDPSVPPWHNLKEGVAYAWSLSSIRTLLLIVALAGFAGMPYRVLMPVFATDVLHGDAHTLGFLTGGIGVGALAGALFLAARRGVRGLGRVILVAVLVFGASLVGFAASRSFALSLVLVFFAGFGMMVQTASCNTILQTIVDDDKRGRVMSFYAAALQGTMPLGSLLAGTLAGAVGAPRTVLLGGAACLLGALGYARILPALRREIRPIYVRLGIIPEVAAGLQSATEPIPAARPLPVKREPSR